MLHELFVSSTFSGSRRQATIRPQLAYQSATINSTWFRNSNNRAYRGLIDGVKFPNTHNRTDIERDPLGFEPSLRFYQRGQKLLNERAMFFTARRNIPGGWCSILPLALFFFLSSPWHARKGMKGSLERRSWIRSNRFLVDDIRRDRKRKRLLSLTC